MALLLLLTATVIAEVVGEAWVYAPGASERELLASQSVGFAEGIANGWIRVHGTADELDALETLGFPLADRREDHRTPRFRDDAYHTPETMILAMESLAEAHPDKARIIQLGQTVYGRSIIGLHIGHSNSSAWRILGAHHGDELISAEVSLEIARAVLEEAPGFEGLVDTQELLVVPHVNPDGVANGTRYNAHGVDLNRNYSFQWSSQEYRSGTAPFSEPETRFIREISLNSSFLAGLSVHAGATNLGYVWNWTIIPTHDEELLHALGERYANACTQDGFWLTNGAEWYQTRGDSTDWSYGLQGTLDYTLEVSALKSPPEFEIEQIVSAHLPAASNWLKTPTPLYGITLDAETMNPIPAALQLVGETPIFHSHPVHGGFSRVLESGTFTLKVQAPGYTPQSLDIVLDQNESILVEILLQRESLSEFLPDPRLLSRGQDFIELRLPGLDPLPESITFYRHGLESQSFSREGDHYRIEPRSLAAGPWTLIVGEEVLPRAVFVGNLSNRVRIDALVETEQSTWLEGSGFAQGTEVLALWGMERSAHPIDLHTFRSDRLEIDTSSFPDNERIDLWIRSNGAELAIVDIQSTQGLDTAAPPDTGEEDSGEGSQSDPGDVQLIPVSACTTSPLSSPSALWLLTLAGLSRRTPKCPAPSPRC